jgi:hypothetical protein
MAFSTNMNQLVLILGIKIGKKIERKLRARNNEQLIVKN